MMANPAVAERPGPLQHRGPTTAPPDLRQPRHIDGAGPVVQRAGQRPADRGDQRGRTNPAFADDTVYAWSEVLDKAELDAPASGRCVIGWWPRKGRDESMMLQRDDGSTPPHVLLDLDLWVLCPR